MSDFSAKGTSEGHFIEGLEWSWSEMLLVDKSVQMY